MTDSQILDQLRINFFSDLYQNVGGVFSPESFEAGGSGGPSDVQKTQTEQEYDLGIAHKTQLLNELKDLTTRGYKETRMYQVKDYEVNKLKFWTTYIEIAFILFAFNMVFIALRMAKKITSLVLASIVTLSSVMFLSILFIDHRRNSSRSTYNWNKFYWTTKVKEESYKRNMCG